jgi:DNA polymerase-1
VKLKGTYVDALPQMILARTGRIHTSFSQTAATTGRLASSEPNLQNIPIRTELGNRIRRAFVPSEDGWLLMSADYSQIELRILAHLSGDAALIAAFQDDQDIHRFVASQVYGVRPDDVTPEQRRAAKAVNFGIVYGLTPYGLSRDIGVPVRDAEAFIEAYFCRHPGVRRFIDETIHAARRDGRVETLKGRRRPLPDIQSSDANRRAFAERAAVNTVVQGSAADMMKLAMIRLRAACAEAGLKARLLLQIHDELLLEFPPKEERRLRAVVTEAMENAMPLKVPVRVQTAVGANWLEAK